MTDGKNGAVDIKIDEALAELEKLRAEVKAKDEIIESLSEQLKVSTDLHEADVRGKLIKWMRENTTIPYETILHMKTDQMKGYKDAAKHFKAPTFLSSADGRTSPNKVKSTEEMLDAVYNADLWNK